jgi:hypothetical protein
MSNLTEEDRRSLILLANFLLVFLVAYCLFLGVLIYELRRRRRQGRLLPPRGPQEVGRKLPEDFST